MHDLRPALSLATAALLLGACATAPAPRTPAQAPAAAPAPAELPDSIVRAVDRVFAEYDGVHSPGCAAGVVRGRDLVLARGYGMASLEHKVGITPQTAFYAASVSKQFTAFAVALLADQGKLSLDDDIRKWIPEVPDFGPTITIRHLLHHTSGLRDYFGLLALTGWPHDGRLAMDDVLDMVSRQRSLNFPPGTQYLYSNTGYILLATLVERASGQSLREFAKAHVFDPLGMSRTTFRDDHTMLIEDRALAYAPDPERGYRLDVPGFAVVGDGGLYTTIEDLARWAENLGTRAVGGSRVAAMMLTRGVLTSGDTLDYALGLSMGGHRGLSTVGHGGSYAGYRTALTRFPDHELAVVTLCNRSDASPGDRALRVAEVFLGEHMEPERAKPAAAGERVAVDPALLERYAGTYRADDGNVLTFASEGDRFFYVAPSGERLPMVALSDTAFQIEGRRERVSFHREPDGSVQRGTLPHADDLPIRRIQPWTPSAQELAAYAGRYYSPEVDTFYDVVLEDGRLVARHRRRADLPLTPVARDTFAGDAPFRDVRFERDADGQINGFFVSAGRTNDIRFEKRE